MKRAAKFPQCVLCCNETDLSYVRGQRVCSWCFLCPHVLHPGDCSACLRDLYTFVTLAGAFIVSVENYLRAAHHAGLNLDTLFWWGYDEDLEGRRYAATTTVWVPPTDVSLEFPWPMFHHLKRSPDVQRKDSVRFDKRRGR